MLAAGLNVAGKIGVQAGAAAIGGGFAGVGAKVAENIINDNEKYYNGIGKAALFGLGAGLLGGALGGLGGEGGRLVAQKFAQNAGEQSMILIRAGVGAVAGGLGSGTTAMVVKVVDNIIQKGKIDKRDLLVIIASPQDAHDAFKWLVAHQYIKDNIVTDNIDKVKDSFLEEEKPKAIQMYEKEIIAMLKSVCYIWRDVGKAFGIAAASGAAQGAVAQAALSRQELKVSQLNEQQKQEHQRQVE